MATITGTEKQIKWATDILKKHEIGIANKLEQSMWSDEEKDVLKERLKWLLSQTSASAIINMATNDLWDENGMGMPE